MKLLLLSLCLISISSIAQSPNPTQPPLPNVQELDFLTGTWDISFEIYDTHHPESGILFTEKGQQVCYYDLPQNGVPKFITCKGEVTSSKGRVRTFSESIRYGRFSKAFERTGIFSNWPATSKEFLFYDSISRKMTLEGELEVEHNMIERYEDIYSFSPDFSSYTRRNVANFSNMPITQFNITLLGTGTKLK
jgi:hypothetical protein